ncbi:MAG: zinc protease, partial [Actinomycetota bacterium]|nr:zinc protease [Actinomycetota bacterium]
VDDELARLAAGDLDADEVGRVQARQAASLLTRNDFILGRTLLMAAFEQQRNNPGLVGELPARLGTVTPEQVVEAAGHLQPDRRARLDLVPGGNR